MKDAMAHLPSKNRLDVVDTALLRMREKQALKWLLALLVFALGYEFRESIPSPFAVPDQPVAELNPAVRRLFPVKRLGRLTQVLRDLQQTIPLVRNPLRPLLLELARLQDLDPKKVVPQQLSAELVPVLTGLWSLFHSPLWEDPKPFRLPVLEVRTLFQLLRVDPPDIREVPSLVIGPRPVGELGVVERDLFRFGGVAGETGEDGGGVAAPDGDGGGR